MEEVRGIYAAEIGKEYCLELFGILKIGDLSVVFLAFFVKRDLAG